MCLKVIKKISVELLCCKFSVFAAFSFQPKQDASKGLFGQQQQQVAQSQEGKVSDRRIQFVDLLNDIFLNSRLDLCEWLFFRSVFYLDRN